MISPEILRRFPLFAGLDDDMLKQIAMLGDEREMDAEEWLFHEGDDAHTLFLLLDGAVSLTINMDSKGERMEEVTTLGMNEVIGWSAMVEPCCYTLGGQTATKSTVAAIDGDGLRTLMDENPETGYLMMRAIARLIGERLVNMRVQFVSMTI